MGPRNRVTIPFPIPNYVSHPERKIIPLSSPFSIATSILSLLDSNPAKLTKALRHPEHPVISAHVLNGAFWKRENRARLLFPLSSHLVLVLWILLHKVEASLVTCDLVRFLDPSGKWCLHRSLCPILLFHTFCRFSNLRFSTTLSDTDLLCADLCRFENFVLSRQFYSEFDV